MKRYCFRSAVLAAIGLVWALPMTALGPIAAMGRSPGSLPELLRTTHVHGLAVDRSDPARLFVATHHGLYAVRTGDGRVTLVSAGRDDLMGFTPHPTTAAVLYASGHPATGGNLGFIASTDGGRTWKSLSGGAGGPVDFHQMDVSKADPRVVFGVHGGLQVSRDGGLRWELIGQLPDGVIALAASSRDVNRLYLATRQGLMLSRDGGRNWQPAHFLRRPSSAVATAAGGTVFAFVLGSGLLRAEEPALEWQTVSNGLGEQYLLHLAIDPADHDRLFAATQTGAILSSKDGGRSWDVLAAP